MARAGRSRNEKVAERRGWSPDIQSDIWIHPSGARITGTELAYHHLQHIEIILCNLERRQDEVRKMPIGGPDPNKTNYGIPVNSTAATTNVTAQQQFTLGGGPLLQQGPPPPQYEHYEYKVCGHVHNYLTGQAIPPECPVCAKQEQQREENIKKLAAERKRKQDEAAAVAREPIAWLDAQVELVCAEGRP